MFASSKIPEIPTKEPSSSSTVLITKIHSDWTVCEEGSDQIYPAKVPGTVHTDLLENNVIPDPFVRDNERSIQWIGERNWIYKTEFSVPDAMRNCENLILRFHGLDTYADVYLNEQKNIDADNMFRTWEIDVKDLLLPDMNTLTIRFRNVFDENIPKWKSAPFRLMAGFNNDQADVRISMYSRKAQYHYGWDWGPRLVTCGIWKPVELIGWNDFILRDVYAVTGDVSNEEATIKTFLHIQSSVERTTDVVISMDGENMYTGKLKLHRGNVTKELSFQLNEPRLWWTNGLGEPYLYDFKVSVTDDSGNERVHEFQFGVRSVELIREKDSNGRSFYVKLNGVRVFMKGANYVPQNNFTPRITYESYDRIIRSAADAHMNMLRVWGGGIYQNDEFYNLCDRYGILVWQDMMFACAMYPADEVFLESVYNEVVDNVKRIRNHPCVALYCGNNEIDMIWKRVGWKDSYSPDEQRQIEKDYHALFKETIPKALQEADPSRQYVHTSPIAGIGDRPASEGNIHYWGVWHGGEPFEDFENNLARFITEYGFQSFPPYASIKKFTDPEDRDPSSAVMLAHQRCYADNRRDKEYANRVIRTSMEKYYKPTEDFESFVYVSQLLQAEGIQTAIEVHRRAMPYTMGTLYWQLNDSWPSISWSSIDYNGHWKALHYYVCKLYRPVIISPRCIGNSMSVFIISDLLEKLEDDLTLQAWDVNEGKLSERSLRVTIPANSSTKIAEFQIPDILNGRRRESSLISLQFRDYRRLVYLLPVKDLELPTPHIHYTLESVTNGVNIQLTTNVLAKNVYLEAGDDFIRSSDNFFDMLPGESVTIFAESTSEKLKNLRVKTLVDMYAEA